MATENTSPGDPVAQLELTGITKQYPGTLANDAIDLSILPGEVHALLGENGAGKSTLVKIIYGVVKADAGAIRWQGELVDIKSPAHARHLGIGMVFQHFNLFDTLTVAENPDLGALWPADRPAPARA
jgi:simple sugar transport system ATP-binding protein